MTPLIKMHTRGHDFVPARSFARSEDILPAPEPAHAIWGSMQEALACKESGESQEIVFNMCGHRHFDLAASEQHLADNLEDFDYPEEAIRASLEKVPRSRRRLIADFGLLSRRVVFNGRPVSSASSTPFAA